MTRLPWANLIEFSKNKTIMENKSRLDLINSSGFLFQLAVERELEKLTYEPSPVFESVVSEYPWLDSASSKGFIDFVATQRYHDRLEIRFVIECKRSHRDWIFLAQPLRETPCKGIFRWTRTIVTPGRFPHQNAIVHTDFPLTSTIPNSEFCVMESQKKERPLLEYDSGRLLDATEALSVEDLNTSFKFAQDLVKIYLPILITTATLVIAPIDPERISISSGEIKECEFNEIPAVLFRKSFAADRVRTEAGISLRKSKRARERTVLIVHAKHLTEVLQTFQIHWTWLKDQHQDRLPWEL